MNHSAQSPANPAPPIPSGTEGDPGLRRDPDPGESVAAAITGRRTIHEFRDEAPPPALVRSALEAARWAPNHHLTEPWHVYQLGPETREAVCRLNERLVAAARGEEAGRAKYERWRRIPGWLVLTCERSPDPVRAREDFAACCCFLQNFALWLWPRGVGVKWTTGAVTRAPEFFDLLWIDPRQEELVGLVWYGYPREVPGTARAPLESALVALP